MKKKAKLVVGDDGCFWMNMTDFRKYFTLCFICKYENNFVFSYRQNHSREGIFEFEIIVPGKYTFAIS